MVTTVAGSPSLLISEECLVVVNTWANSTPYKARNAPCSALARLCCHILVSLANVGLFVAKMTSEQMND